MSPMQRRSLSTFHAAPLENPRALRLAFAHERGGGFGRPVFFWTRSARLLPPYGRRSQSKASTDFIRKDKLWAVSPIRPVHAARRNRTATQRIDRTSAAGVRD